MDIKELLGEKYTEGMTPEEMIAAMAEVEAPKPEESHDMRQLKESLRKATAEAAENKRKLRSMMSDEEQRKQAAEDAQRDLEERYAALLKESTVSKSTSRLLEIGMEAPLAAELSEAMYGMSDPDALFAGLKKYAAGLEKSLRAQILKDTPAPEVGDEKAIAAAQDRAETNRMRAWAGLPPI